MAITNGIYYALDPVTGNRQFVYAIGVSAGAPDSGKMPLLDVNGKIDPSMTYGGMSGLTAGDVLDIIDTQKVTSYSGSGDAGKLAALGPSGRLDSDFLLHVATSVGPADAGKFVVLGPDGKLDVSLLQGTNMDEILALIIALG